MALVRGQSTHSRPRKFMCTIAPDAKLAQTWALLHAALLRNALDSQSSLQVLFCRVGMTLGALALHCCCIINREWIVQDCTQRAAFLITVRSLHTYSHLTLPNFEANRVPTLQLNTFASPVQSTANLVTSSTGKSITYDFTAATPVLRKR